MINFKTVEEKEEFRNTYKTCFPNWKCYCSSFCQFSDVCDKSLDSCIDYNVIVEVDNFRVSDEDVED